MLDIDILGTIDPVLASMRETGLSRFVRTDQRGARHSLDWEDDKLSPINTGALLSVGAAFPLYRATNDPDSWIAEVVRPEIGRLAAAIQVQTKKAAGSKNCEFEAYRLAKVLQAAPDDTARLILATWLEQYLEGWAKREHDHVQVYVVALLWSAIKQPDFLSGRVERLAEATVARQLAAIGDGGLGSVDFVDVGLALSIGRVPPQLARRAFEVLDEAASGTALWANHGSAIMLGSRAVVCSSFEVAVALLKRSPRSTFSGLRSALIAHLDWVLERADNEPFMVSDAHSRAEARETWFNCLVIEYLELLRAAAQESVQRALHTKLRSRLIEDVVPWSDLALREGVREAIEDSVLRPAVDPTILKPNARTVLLFGPPGTAKTTVAESLAHKLKWPFVDLGVADLLRDGLEKVYATAIELFEDLAGMERAVVLLDEVEALFADRDEKGLALMQQFLTAALLPPLKQLHDSGNIVLVIATNYVERFDSAIRRPGRIDLILPIGPPDEDQRKELLVRVAGVEPDTAADLARLLRDGTTIGELLAFKRIVAAQPRAAAMDLHTAWREAIHRQPQISDDKLKAFEQQVEDYARYE